MLLFNIKVLQYLQKIRKIVLSHTLMLEILISYFGLEQIIINLNGTFSSILIDNLQSTEQITLFKTLPIYIFF